MREEGALKELQVEVVVLVIVVQPVHPVDLAVEKCTHITTVRTLLYLQPVRGRDGAPLDDFQSPLSYLQPSFSPPLLLPSHT